MCVCVSICGEMRQYTYFIFLWIQLLIGWREVDGRKTEERRKKKSWLILGSRVTLTYTSSITVFGNNFFSWFLIRPDTSLHQWLGYILSKLRNRRAQNLWQSYEPTLQNSKQGRHQWFWAQLEYENSPHQQKMVYKFIFLHPIKKWFISLFFSCQVPRHFY